MRRFRKAWFANRWTSIDGYLLAFTDSSRAPWMKYSDARRTVFAGMEMLAGKGVGFALFADQMHLDRPNGPVLSDAAIKQTVVERIRALFDHLGWRLEIT